MTVKTTQFHCLHPFWTFRYFGSLAPLNHENRRAGKGLFSRTRGENPKPYQLEKLLTYPFREEGGLSLRLPCRGSRPNLRGAGSSGAVRRQTRAAAGRNRS